MKKERLMGPDIVRSFAILFVILIHSALLGYWDIFEGYKRICFNFY